MTNIHVDINLPKLQIKRNIYIYIYIYIYIKKGPVMSSVLYIQVLSICLPGSLTKGYLESQADRDQMLVLNLMMMIMTLF